MKASSADTLLDASNLRMYFPIRKGILRNRVSLLKAVDDVSFSIRRGQALGLVGESGCGKTTVGRCVLRLYEPSEGRILFEGADITHVPERDIRPLRRRMQLIFQDPYGSLNPRQSAGQIVGAPLVIHRLVRDRREYRERVDSLFRTVGLDPCMADRVPHEFSGGQRQRVGIARALACDPSFIVCDEPISALDVSIQAQIIGLLQELQSRLGLTYLFIAHDLSVVRHLCDWVAVMYLGRVVELTDWRELYERPQHPYTRALLAAVPIPDPFVEEQRELIVLEGDVPSPVNPPPGCSFHPRCPMAVPDCRAAIPPLRDVGSGHRVACIRV